MENNGVYCSNCGSLCDSKAVVCVHCGVPLNNATAEINQKSKVAAGLFGIFLGQWGVHNFYLGYTGKAIIQVLMTVAGLILAFIGIGLIMIFASAIWGFIEGILILNGSIDKDAKGRPLRS